MEILSGKPQPAEMWIVLREGRIVQDGSPGDLMVMDGPYHRLIQRKMIRPASEAAYRSLFLRL